MSAMPKAVIFDQPKDGVQASFRASTLSQIREVSSLSVATQRRIEAVGWFSQTQPQSSAMACFRPQLA